MQQSAPRGMTAGFRPRGLSGLAEFEQAASARALPRAKYRRVAAGAESCWRSEQEDELVQGSAVKGAHPAAPSADDRLNGSERYSAERVHWIVTSSSS